MDKTELIEQILRRWTRKSETGAIDINDLSTFKAVLKECNIPESLQKSIYESFLRVDVSEKASPADTNQTITVDEETYELAKTFGFTGKYEDVKYTDLSKLKSIKYNSSGGVIEKSIVSYDELKNFITTQNKIYVNVSKTVIKLRNFLDKRIAQLNPAIFLQLYGILEIYRDHKEIFSFKKLEAVGVNYEIQRVDELNLYLSNLTNPKKLYIRGGTEPIYDAGVGVNGAIKVPGTGKADIALTGNGTELFWISYKHGAFFKSDIKELAAVAFQQYGSLQTLYDLSEKNATEASFGEFKYIIDKFMAYIVEKEDADIIINVVDIDLIKTDDVVVLIKDDNSKLYYSNKPNPKYPNLVVDPDKFDKLYKKGGAILSELRSTRQKLNIYFYKQGNNYFYDYAKTKEFGGTFSSFDGMKNMVGKSIYGTDFTIDNKVFGRENVNVLVQTDRNFVLQPYPFPNGDDVLINVDKTGHVLYNPNFPNEQLKDIKDLVEKYLPVIVGRYGEKESFKFKDSAGNNIFLGCRMLVMPKAKAGNATEIKNI